MAFFDGADDLQAKGGEIGVECSEQEGEEGDVEEREGLMGDMSSDHQAHSVSKRESNVEDPGNQVLVDNLGGGIQPKEGDQRHANIRKDTDQSRCNGQVLVLARLDHMLESKKIEKGGFFWISVSDLHKSKKGF
jgi:hypothetical protein